MSAISPLALSISLHLLVVTNTAECPVAVKIAQGVEAGERQAEIEHLQWEAKQLKWRREEEERRAAEAIKESHEELQYIIDK